MFLILFFSFVLFYFIFKASLLQGRGEQSNDDPEEVECTSKAIGVMVSAKKVDTLLTCFNVCTSRSKIPVDPCLRLVRTAELLFSLWIKLFNATI